MAYELSFSDEFFQHGFEPDELALNANGEPFSVYAALHLMHSKRRTEWNALARERFSRHGTEISTHDVMLMIRETNTCSNLDSPVEVWIDPDGDYRIDVHEATHYSYGSGMSGCMFDNQGTARNKADAIESALCIFDGQISGREMKRAKKALREDGIYRFARPVEAGAEYVEVSEQRGEYSESE